VIGSHEKKNCFKVTFIGGLLGGAWLTTPESDSPASLAPGGVPADAVAVLTDAVAEVKVDAERVDTDVEHDDTDASRDADTDANTAAMPAPLSPEIMELDARVGDFFKRDKDLPSNVTRGMVIMLLQAYKARFDVVRDVGSFGSSTTQRLNEVMFTQEDGGLVGAEDESVVRVESVESVEDKAVSKTFADYQAAVRQSQAATQASTQANEVQRRDERHQARERRQREKRDCYTKATGRWPTCPIMCGSKTCNGDLCGDLYPEEKFDHPTVCRDKSHVVRGKVGGCLLFHFWPQQPKNSRGGTSGGYSGGNPRQTGKWQGNAPRQGNAPKQGYAHHSQAQVHHGQVDSKEIKDLKAKLSKARTELKTERLGKQPTYSQVAAPTIPLQQALVRQPVWQPTHLAPTPASNKNDKLAEALKMMAEQLAVISAMT
jgi:hypothetical protein